MDIDDSFIDFDNHWLALDHDLHWLEALLDQRCMLLRFGKYAFNLDALVDMLPRAPIDPVDYRPSAYAALLEKVFDRSLVNELLHSFQLSDDTHRFVQYAERVVLLLSLTPYLRPELLDCFRVQDDLGRRITEFGGITSDNFVGFLPTGETAVYALAGQDFKKRALVQAIVHPKHYLFEQGILSLLHTSDNEPPLSSQLILSDKYVDILVRGQDSISEKGRGQEDA